MLNKSEKFGGDAHEEIPCIAWTNKAPKFAQPDLNFIGKFHIFQIILIE